MYMFYWTITSILTVFLATGLSSKSSVMAADEQNNAREFNALCVLVSLAKNGAATPDIEGNFSELSPVFSGIETLYHQTTDNETEYAAFVDKNPAAIRPPASPGRALARKKIEYSFQKVQELRRRYKLATENIKRLYEEADQHMRQAIFGTEAKQWGETGAGIQTAPSGGNRVDVCGKEATVGLAGQAILVDLACICAGKSATSTKPCTPEAITGWQSTQWANQGLAAGRAAVDHCPISSMKATQENIAAALYSFQTLLGTQPNTNTKSYMLGKVNHDVGTDGCDGTDTNQICLNYKGHLLKGGGLDKIPWYKEFLTASAKIGVAGQEEKKLHAILHRAFSLEAVAQSAFEEGLHKNLEKVTHPTSPKAVSNASQSAESPLVVLSVTEAKPTWLLIPVIGINL